MLNLDEMRSTAKNDYALFFKLGCKYSRASEELMLALRNAGIIKDYKLYIMGEDYSQEQLTDLCGDYGIEPKGFDTKVTIPQVIMKGEYIGGADAFYASRWNLGDEDSGIIYLYDKDGNEWKFPAPKMVNPTIIQD